MKIGICTLCNSYNFGAFLQAFALQETLKKYSDEVEFLKLSGKKLEKLIYLKNKNIKKVLYNIKQVKKFEEDFEKLNISKERYNKDILYDAIVVGSDELWNIKNTSFKHCDEYFGINLNSKNIIAYAPSCNNITSEELIEYNNRYNFKNFSFLSGRDENTLELIKNITGQKPELVLDPTFLIDDYDKYIVKTNLKNFIAVYGYQFSKEQIMQIKQYAKQKGMKTVSLGLYNEWCDENVQINAFEFLGYMKNADFVFTSTFHGTIFSIILEKNFITFSNNSSKIKFLLKEFNLENRDFATRTINEEEMVEINYASVKNIRKAMREKSLDYLKSAIRRT